MSQYFVREAPVSVHGSNFDMVNALFRKVYQWMAGGLILTAVVAYATATYGQWLLLSPLVFVLFALELGLVWYLSARIDSISPQAASGLFLAYSLVNGLTLSAVLLVYEKASVYNAFFSTAGMFGVMSVYGLYTKRDLTSMGSFLRMGLWGLIIAMLVNWFIGSKMMDFYISAFAVLIFLGLTAWDTQKIRDRGYELEGGEEGVMMHRAAIMGALELYLDFINLFLHLLRLFGKRR